MRRLVLFALSALFASAVFAEEEKPKIDPLRPHLNQLYGRDRVKDSDFKYPFLLSQTAVVVGKSAEVTSGSVREFVSKGKLAVAGHYFGANPGKITVELPEAVKTGKQLDGIRECNVDKCLMKLHTEKEKSAMQTADAKVATFQNLISQRLQVFLSKRELLGYEDRESNRDYVQKMLAEFGFLNSRYPQVAKFFESGFWKNEKAPASLVRTTIRQELVSIAPDRLQPIWRMGEVFEFKEGASWLFFELHIYSNHYMDSSIRIYEVFPLETKSVLVISDIMEIDELTKSAIIRVLYKGKMEDAVSEAQNQDLAKIL